MTSRVPRPSLLLQHIHGTIPALTRLYAEAASAAATTTAKASSCGLHARDPGKAFNAFPPDPQTSAEGERVLDFFCHELGMGRQSLSLWRQRAMTAASQYWQIPSIAAATPRTLSEAGSQQGVCPSTPACAVENTALPAPIAVPRATAAAATGGRADVLYLQPRRQDVAFMQSAMSQLRLLPSPLITLSPPPCALDDAPMQTVESRTVRASSEATTSRFYATRRIPAGMFVLSVPTEAVLMAQPPPSADPVLSFFLHLDDLIGQLLAAEEEGPTHPHYGYVYYLKDSVVPCRNLPFLSRKAMEKLVGPSDASTALETEVTGAAPPTKCREEEGSADKGIPTDLREGVTVKASASAGSARSPAWALWEFFHVDMERKPLSPFLRDRLSADAYAWWASAVLSRRTGTAMLIPVADKLNHHPLPNCYYTMGNEASLCGLDVLDNLIAGVPLDLLYQPYVHIFTIREVEPGEELTLCYASPEQGHYQPASRRMPAVPTRPTAHEPSVAPNATRDDLTEAFATLFPSTTATVTAPLYDADSVAQSLQSVTHPSARQEVRTSEGRARWQLQWGFVPLCDSVFSAKDLEEVAGIVAERRVDTRAALFPALPSPAK